jgi:hypothetical protein
MQDSKNSTYRIHQKMTYISDLTYSGFWIVALRENNMSIELEFERYKGIVNGMHHWSVVIATREEMKMHDLNTKRISHYCILLPKLTTKWQFALLNHSGWMPSQIAMVHHAL